MRIAFSASVLLLSLAAVASAHRGCTISAGHAVVGTTAYPATTASNQGLCCELCSALPDCVGATFNKSSSACQRYQKVASTVAAVGVNYLTPNGSPSPAPAQPFVRWMQNPQNSALQYYWTGVGTSFTATNGCELRSIATGAKINNTCTVEQWSQSWTINNTYVIGNAESSVALVTPAPGWFLALSDGSMIASQPIAFDATGKQPPIGVALTQIQPVTSTISILTAFDLTNGNVLWRTHEYPQRASSGLPYAIEKSGNVVLFTFTVEQTQYIVAFDAPTGVQLWNVSQSSQNPVTSSGNITANSRFAASSFGTQQEQYALWSATVVDITTGQQRCNAWRNAGSRYCSVIGGTMDAEDVFALWCEEKDPVGPSFASVSIMLFNANTCNVTRTIAVDEIQGIVSQVNVQYDAKTRSFVASDTQGSQVVAYSRDTGLQVWAYQAETVISAVAVGEGLAIVSFNSQLVWVALEL